MAAGMRRWDDIRQVWAGGLAPIPLERIRPEASTLTREVLSTVGLPTEKESSETYFYHDERLLRPVTFAGRLFLPFNQDHRALLAVEPDGDAVYALYPVTPPVIQFVNTDLADFIYCYGLLRARVPDLRAATEARQVKAIVGQLRRRIKAADPQALADKANWWLSTLDQARQGEI
jgi:hypothetical protein